MRKKSVLFRHPPQPQMCLCTALLLLCLHITRFTVSRHFFSSSFHFNFHVSLSLSESYISDHPHIFSTTFLISDLSMGSIKRVGKYELSRTIGSGTFSKVKLGKDCETQQACAIKIIDIEQLVRENLNEQLLREISLMKVLRHNNIVELLDVIRTPNHIYLVLELLTGGELFNRLTEEKRFSEDVARNYFHQLVAAVMYCHRKGVAHRDLKPENLLLSADGVLKISDFGLSNLQRSSQSGTNMLQTVCGTPNYVAPEVLKEQGYDGLIADVWSCGIILFSMLAGYLPFDDNMNTLFTKIARGKFSMARHFSEGAKDLVGKMLVTDPAQRITLEAVTTHSWFAVDWKPEMLKGKSE